MDGIICLHKPPGPTSHDQIQALRKILRQKRIGHAGTLDPGAGGVLVIGVGKATRILEYLTLDQKTYLAEAFLGLTTDTQDLSGQILTRSDPSLITAAMVEKGLKSFLGESLQTPPMFSAVKVGGQKLYEYARKGIAIEREQRQITIQSIELTQFDQKTGRLQFEVTCSKGTYVRTLCHDLGVKLGCGAVMGSLVRIASGGFTLDQAFTLEQIQQQVASGRHDFLISINKALAHLPEVQVPDNLVTAVSSGRALKVDNLDWPAAAVLRLTNSGQCLALGKVAEGEGEKWIKVSKVFISN